MNKSNRGGKRMGAGRKAKGITKKVSLTLTDEMWNEINQFDGTVADYIRSLKKTTDEKSNFIQVKQNIKEMNKVTQFKHQGENQELTKERAQYYWELYKQEFLQEQSPEERVSDQAVENAYRSLMGLFKGTQTAQIETSMRYRSPFTNKWFSSMKNLLKTEVPTLITWAQSSIVRKKEAAERFKKDEDLKRMSQETLDRQLLS
jgi:hypothetical protein